MVSAAMLVLVESWHKFDPDKMHGDPEKPRKSNAFAYYTTCCYRIFLKYMKDEQHKAPVALKHLGNEMNRTTLNALYKSGVRAIVITKDAAQLLAKDGAFHSLSGAVFAKGTLGEMCGISFFLTEDEDEDEE